MGTVFLAIAMTCALFLVAEVLYGSAAAAGAAAGIGGLIVVLCTRSHSLAARRTSAVSSACTENKERCGRKETVRVAVTGAAGNVSYALLFRLASGQVLGTDQPLSSGSRRSKRSYRL